MIFLMQALLKNRAGPLRSTIPRCGCKPGKRLTRSGAWRFASWADTQCCGLRHGPCGPVNRHGVPSPRWIRSATAPDGLHRGKRGQAAGASGPGHDPVPPRARWR